MKCFERIKAALQKLHGSELRGRAEKLLREYLQSGLRIASGPGAAGERQFDIDAARERLRANLEALVALIPAEPCEGWDNDTVVSVVEEITI